MENLRKIKLPNELLFNRIKELVGEGHSVTFRVKGNSMNPFLIDQRDEVTVSPFQNEDLRPGSIILAKDRSNRIILHRVIAIQGNKIKMMGDGNPHGTETTEAEQVAGIVTEVIRKGKKISCQDKGWKTASYWWNVLRPLRRWLLGIWRRTPLKYI